MTDQDIFRTVVELESLGMARKDIAASLGKSASQATRYFAPNEGPVEAKEYFLAGKLTLGHCYRIATSPEPLATMDLFLRGETQKEAVRKAKASSLKSTPAVRASTLKCPLPSGHTVTIKGDDLSLEEALEVLAVASKAIREGLKRNFTAKTFQAAARDMAAAAG